MEFFKLMCIFTMSVAHAAHIKEGSIRQPITEHSTIQPITTPQVIAAVNELEPMRSSYIEQPIKAQYGGRGRAERLEGRPMMGENREGLHTAHKRSVCSEPSGADLEVQLQLFRSGITTPSPADSSGGVIEPSTWLQHAGYQVFWEGYGCGVAPSALIGAFPTTTIEGRAACPWRYHVNTTLSRYPRDINYAQCACASCAEVSGDTFSLLNTCRPILRNTHVLRRTDQCEGDVYVYEPVIEPVPVACVCVRPRISQGGLN